MTIKLADLTLDPPVFLAPMAGITDLPFRNLVSEFGAGLVVSEMVASREMLSGRAEMLARSELGTGAAAVQIAGNDAGLMAECARICEGAGARIIDINMGCPAKKVTGHAAGAALMRDPDRALKLIEAVVGAVSVPVTLKMRLGWDENSLNAPEIAARAEAAGIRMLTVHGRTRQQFYKDRADWAAIAAVVRRVKIPVIANGDIRDSKDARAALGQSGASGVMVGRGAEGRPWRLAEIAADLFGAPAPAIPEGRARAALILRHYRMMLSFYGRDLGARVARKHLGWYLDDLAPPPELRRAILTETSPRRVAALVTEACHRATGDSGAGLAA